jgi:hypothetical protein
MNHYVLEKIAYGRIAEDEQAAARERLALEADRARAEARQAEGSLFAGFLRTLLGRLRDRWSGLGEHSVDSAPVKRGLAEGHGQTDRERRTCMATTAGTRWSRTRRSLRHVDGEQDRRTLAAEGGKREARHAAGSPVAELLRSFSSAFGCGRPALLSE